MVESENIYTYNALWHSYTMDNIYLFILYFILEVIEIYGLLQSRMIMF